MKDLIFIGKVAISTVLFVVLMALVRGNWGEATIIGVIWGIAMVIVLPRATDWWNARSLKN
jgi:uncharacterized protein YhhL (DUF1145 family)